MMHEFAGDLDNLTTELLCVNANILMAWNFAEDHDGVPTKPLCEGLLGITQHIDRIAENMTKLAERIMKA